MQDSNEMTTPLPQSIQEVESLIISLYQPGTPQHELVQIQERLQRLQQSAIGWNIGDALLASSDANVRFFGALTFTVKLNSTESLQTEDADFVESKILHWIVTLCNGQDTRVVRKLCSTLALFYVTAVDRLHACIVRLVSSCLGNGIANLAQIQAITSSELMSVDHIRMAMILQFARALTEASGNTLTHCSSEQSAIILTALEKSLSDVFTIVKFVLGETSRLFTPGNNDGRELDKRYDMSLSCISAWAFFNLNWWERRQAVFSGLRECLDLALPLLQLSQSDDAMEEVAEVLSNCGILFEDQQLRVISQLLRSEWGKEQLKEILDGNSEAQHFVTMLLAYGDLTIKHLVTEPESPETQGILNLMQELLRSPGLPGVEDDIIIDACVLWTSFAEYVEENQVEEEKAGQWLPSAKQQLINVVNSIWTKVKLPAEDSPTLDSDSKAALMSFRLDASDLLQSIYRILGTSLVQNFTNLCAEAGERQDWYDVEASLFCLHSISQDSLEANDRAVGQLFETRLFAQLSSIEVPVPSPTRRAAIDFVGSYSKFFQRNTQYLSPALNFLFHALEKASLSGYAARAIASLCSSCRTQLTSDLDPFFHQFEVFLTWPTAAEFTIVKIVGGISCILEALPSASATLTGIHRLLDFVESSVQAARVHMSNGEAEQSQASASIAMHCLTRMANSLNPPDDAVVDLETDKPGTNENGFEAGTVAELDHARNRIFQAIVSTLEILGTDGDVIEEVCNVLKPGLTESESSPFRLPPDTIVQFIQSTRIDTPRLEAVLTLACTFLRSHKRNNTSEADGPASLLLQHLCNLIGALGDPRSDPEVAQSLIEVLTRFMPGYVDTLLQLQPSTNLEQLFNFTIACLEIPEPLPKRSACTFWASYIELDTGTAKVEQSLLDEVLVHFGPALTRSLVSQVAGQANRTDLEYFIRPIKSVMKRHPRARNWLEDALMSDRIPPHVDESVRRRFLQSLGVSNSKKTTKEMVTVFWSVCRGMSANYTPIRK